MRLVRTLLIVAVIALALPAMAAAHASLRASTPADHSTVDSADAIELRFSERVTVLAEAVKVFAPDSARADAGVATVNAAGRTVTQQVDATTDGTYAVAWRATSDDGHTLTGTLTFHLNKPSAGGGKDAEQRGRAAGATPRELTVSMGIARGALLLSLLVVAGGGLFTTVVAPGWRVRWMVVATVGLLVALVTAFVVDAAIGRGVDMADVLRDGALRAELGRPFGRAALVTAALAVFSLAPTLVLRAGSERPHGGAARAMMALLYAGLAASVALSGHAISTEPVAVRLPLDMVHVAAASIWLGGLVQLAGMAPNAHAHAAQVRRFSNVAFPCVLVLLVTGSYAAWVELDANAGELLASQYGRIVLAKLMLYFGTMPLAFLNKTTYVPAIASRPADASRLLRQYVGREIFLLLVIVSITAWLIGTDQPA